MLVRLKKAKCSEPNLIEKIRKTFTKSLFPPFTKDDDTMAGKNSTLNPQGKQLPLIPPVKS